MLKESLEVFKKELDKHGDKLILDSYIPADGTYIIVDIEESVFTIKETIEVKFDKKEKKINLSEYESNKIRELDYNSRLIDMNKPIDSKKIIHSNNYLSFFIKKDKFPTPTDKDKKLTNEIIDAYYDTLANPYLKYKSGKPKEIYKEVENELGEVNVDILNNIKAWIKENIFEIGKECKGKDYLKIFFNYPLDMYIKENKRYVIPNIYNKNDYNKKINEILYGLPNDNMGLNSKKPYLENKTRKTKVPYLIDSNEVLLQKKFFDFLMNFASEGRCNIYISDSIEGKPNEELPDNYFCGSFIRIKKGKELEIQNYDKIVGYSDIFEKEFIYDNVLDLKETKDEKEEFSYGIYVKKKAIQKIISDILFSGYLINNYFTDAGDIPIKNNNLKKNLLVARESIFNWIYKNDSNNVYKVLDRASLDIIKGSLEEGRISKVGKQFNLRCAIKGYFEGGKTMADTVKEMKSKLREKINLKNTDSLNSDEEYYFAVGQLANYFIAQSNAAKRPHYLINSFINTKSDSVIKQKLKQLYKKYNFKGNMYNLKANNLYAMIIDYKPENKVNEDMIISGYLNSNLIFEKNENMEGEK